MKKFLLLLLVLAVLSNVMFASVQRTNFPQTTPVAHAFATSDLLQTRQHIPVISFPDPRNFFRGSGARDKSILWKTYLALQLVRYPQLDQKQVRVILDCIALSSPEFFTTSNHGKTKSDEALESLRRRALAAFPSSHAVELFGNKYDAKADADLLMMYYDISALPLKKRKASFRNASAGNKSGLWKTHLALFFVKLPDLNEWQKSIILTAMSLATPEHFDIRSSDSAWKLKVRDPLRSLEGQIIAAFSFDEGAKIFATLGDDADLAKSSASVFLKRINYYKPLNDSGPYVNWINRFDSQEMALERGSCQCSTESDWCHMSSSCGGGNCNATQSGCGTLWSYPCDGAACQ